MREEQFSPRLRRGVNGYDTPFRDLLAVAFKGRLVDTLDHPVLRRLRGEA